MHERLLSNNRFTSRLAFAATAFMLALNGTSLAQDGAVKQNPFLERILQAESTDLQQASSLQEKALPETTVSRAFVNEVKNAEIKKNRTQPLRDPVAASPLPPIISEPAPAESMADGYTRKSDLYSIMDHRSELEWWTPSVSNSILPREKWVKFDLETVLLDTLQHSPRIKSLTYGAGMSIERIVQQDAEFDPTVLMGGRMGATNDPVGNTLTTGGADRLQEDSFNMRGGIRRNGRRGTEFGLTQEMGTLDSNSTFFSPRDQGNARLSLSLTQPLLDRGGQVYNERLLTQAKLDSKVTWHEMRRDVESRIAEVITSYWRLHEFRCHVLQQRDLLKRGERVQKLLAARRDYDSGQVEMAKARQRVARRRDQLVVFDATVQKQQTRLATLIGSQALCGAEARLELIPKQAPVFPELALDISDVMVQAVENRPEIKAATSQLQAAGLAVKVTKTELAPQINAIFNASLAALNGQNEFGQSFLDQFTGIGPGLSGGIQYEMPYGRRASRAKHHEALHQYHRRQEELREVIQQTQWESEAALIDVRRAMAQRESKSTLLRTALDEERILTRRWELIGGDGARAGVVLENLLDAQQRRTDAEREFVTAQADYMTTLVALQRSMGTLLRYEGINTNRSGSSNVQFVRNADRISHGSPIHHPNGQAQPQSSIVNQHRVNAANTWVAQKPRKIAPQPARTNGQRVQNPSPNAAEIDASAPPAPNKSGFSLFKKAAVEGMQLQSPKQSVAAEFPSNAASASGAKQDPNTQAPPKRTVRTAFGNLNPFSKRR